jgi:hypothetical protein
MATGPPGRARVGRTQTSRRRRNEDHGARADGNEPRVASRRPARGERVVMAGSVLAIIVLIVLPLASPV